MPYATERFAYLHQQATTDRDLNPGNGVSVYAIVLRRQAPCQGQQCSFRGNVRLWCWMISQGSQRHGATDAELLREDGLCRQTRARLEDTTPNLAQNL